MSDGGLRALFRKHITVGVQWTSIESSVTGGGIPDSEYCFEGGISGWVEHKKADHWAVPSLKARPLQIAWIARRARLGGRVWIAVRRAQDELWLVHGRGVAELAQDGLKRLPDNLIAYRGVGGERRWNWDEVRLWLASSC